MLACQQQVMCDDLEAKVTEFTNKGGRVRYHAEDYDTTFISSSKLYDLCGIDAVCAE